MRLIKALLPITLVFKSVSAHERYFLMHPKLRMVAAHMEDYCQENDLPFVITETVTTKKDDFSVNRKTFTHRQGRAFDLSIKNWKETEIIDFVEIFNSEYKSIAAISESDLKPNLVIYKPHGTGPHLHVQIHARFQSSKLGIAGVLDE